MGLTCPDALQGRVEHLIRGESSLGVEERTEADLDVAHTLLRMVQHAFPGDPAHGFGVLHHRKRDREALQILLEAGRLVDHHVRAEGLRIARGQGHAALLRQLQHGPGAQGSVQVHVELRLGKAAERLVRGDERRRGARRSFLHPFGRGQRPVDGPSADTNPFCTSISGAG